MCLLSVGVPFRWGFIRWDVNFVNWDVNFVHWVHFSTKLVLFIRLLANYFFCIVYLRSEMKSIATNSMPEVVSDLSYDVKKMLESCPHGL